MTSTTRKSFTGRPPLEVVLCGRQLALIAMLLMALMLVVAGIAYVAGRMVAPSQVHGASTKPDQTSVIIVDPLPAAAVEEPGGASRLQPGRPVSRLLDPKQARTFLQVAVVEQGMAEATADYLARRGFEAYYAPGAQPSEYRVLVAGGADTPKTQAALEAAGFRSFIRRY